MTNEQIFALAEKYGWQDEFGRWILQGVNLLEFVDAILEKKPWVSLTDTEMCECYNSKSIGYAIEAKLKEKNT
jgi:hypothetical protein